MMAFTVSDLIVQTLRQAGVRRVYGIPGDSLNGFTDALRRDGVLSWQHVRHEEASAFAATADALITGQLAVCAASCGPGNLHLINGLYDAHRSRVPLLAVAAHIPCEDIGSFYFQETHPVELFRECSAYCEMVTSTEQLPYVVDIAIRTAVEQRDVAVLVIPGDVLLRTMGSRPHRNPIIRPTQPHVRPGDIELDRAAQVLNSATRVTILAGAGCADARAEVLALARSLQAPIVHTLRSKEIFEYENPYDVGMTGLLGFRSGYHAMERCEVLLMLGTDFPYRDFYPDRATVVQVDLRGENIGRRTRVDVPLVGTVKDTATVLLPRLERKVSGSHLKRLRHDYASTRRGFDRQARTDHDRTPLHPQFVVQGISDLAQEDAVFLPDVGSPVVWAARHLRMNGRRRIVGSFIHGSMANALPQAVGVQAAQPQRQVITLSGDGGVAMLMGELITLRQLGLPVKVVVFNNGALSFVELEMKAAGLVNFGTDLDNPDFAAVASALGLYGVRVERPGELADAIKAAFAHDGPALIDVVTARQELSIPPDVTFDQVKGFTLYTARTVLSGRGDELVDLTKTNLSDRHFASRS